MKSCGQVTKVYGQHLKKLKHDIGGMGCIKRSKNMLKLVKYVNIFLEIRHRDGLHPTFPAAMYYK